jgi:hypothetical protein
LLRSQKFESQKYSGEQLSFFAFLFFHQILNKDPSGLSFKEKVAGIKGKNIKTHNEDYQIWLEDNKIFLKLSWRSVIHFL